MSGPKRGDPLDRFKTRYVVSSNGCWLWTGAKYSNGYGRFYIGRQDFLAHRVAYDLLVDKVPDGLNVLHSCDSPSCVNPEHLFVGTQSDNLIDAREKGRLTGGQAKLTKDEANSIRHLLEDGHSHSAVAKKFHVSQSLVYMIGNGEVW